MGFNNIQRFSLQSRAAWISYHILHQMVPHVGLKPTSAGLEAAAQSLYQWDIYMLVQ